MKYTASLAASLALTCAPLCFAQQTKEAGQTTAGPAAKESAPAESAAPAKRQLTPAEAKAFAAYKAEMLSIQKWLTGERDASHEKQILAHRLPVNLSARLQKVPLKGLPENLAAAFTAYQKNYAAQAALLKDMPSDDAVAMDWMEKKLADEKYAAATASLDNERLNLESELLAAAIDCGGGI